MIHYNLLGINKMENQEKVLIIFDMDHTILDLNTDVELLKILNKKCPQKIKAIEFADNWALYMNDVMILMKNEGFAISEIKSFIESLELNIGFKDLFDFIKENKNKFEVIIFSGCNTIFVEWVIQYRKLDNLIYKYYSNIAESSTKGVIAIKSTHNHDCADCDKSQCKQILLRDYLIERKKENISFKNMVFVGDGSNDFCLTKILTNNDLVCYRIGYALEKQIKKWLDLNKKEEYLCRVLPWNTGFEIIERLRVLV